MSLIPFGSLWSWFQNLEKHQALKPALRTWWGKKCALTSGIRLPRERSLAAPYQFSVFSCQFSDEDPRPVLVPAKEPLHFQRETVSLGNCCYA
jgi:hypothetical protein